MTYLLSIVLNRLYIHIYTQTEVCIRTYIDTYKDMYTRDIGIVDSARCVYTFIYICKHKYKYVYILIHTYICTHVT